MRPIKHASPPKRALLPIDKFYQQRNKILIVRNTGGLGDIFMHRMMFADFKRIMPEIHLTFACPALYHEAVEDHPFLDEILDSRATSNEPKFVNLNDFTISYNTTSACTRHEIGVAPLSKDHRSDIWANHCGVYLEKHDMHINFTAAEVQLGKYLLHQLSGGKRVAVICPVSAMLVKNLQLHQLEAAANYLRSQGLFVCILHKGSTPEAEKLDIPVIQGVSIREWMSVINAADYVVSVDTAAFHFAGGLGKPLTGIFTFADGKVYGKYFDFVLVQKHRDNGDWACGPCYNWSCCDRFREAAGVSVTKGLPKPCLTEITAEMIISGLEQMVKKWP